MTHARTLVYQQGATLAVGGTLTLDGVYLGDGPITATVIQLGQRSSRGRERGRELEVRQLVSELTH
jgi:hypothetical protein